MQNPKWLYKWSAPRIIWLQALGVDVSKVHATLWLGPTSEAKQDQLVSFLDTWARKHCLVVPSTSSIERPSHGNDVLQGIFVPSSPSLVYRQTLY